jgi:two-component system sensor histidine kinase YesM
MRYVDTISITIEEDSCAKHLPIIKFILQPLVENAVKYSFSEKSYADIFIQTKMIDSQLILMVEDKGVGMSDDMLVDLLHQEDAQESTSVLQSKGTSIGLRNVLGRLQLYYGEDFSYQIDSTKGEGTKIQLCIKYSGGDPRC